MRDTLDNLTGADTEYMGLSGTGHYSRCAAKDIVPKLQSKKRSRELAEAEIQLIALLRGEHAENFSVEIRGDKGNWYVKLWDHDANIAGHGQGNTFSKAWDDTLQRYKS